MGIEKQEIKEEKEKAQPVEAFLGSWTGVEEPETETQRSAWKVLQKRKRVKAVKNLLWMFGQKLFDKDKIEYLRVYGKGKSAQQKVIDEVLKFFSENNVNDFSVDFENHLFGLYTQDESLRSEMKDKYSELVILASTQSLVYENKFGEAVMATPDYELIQRKFSKLVRHYAQNRKMEDQLAVQAD